MPPAIAPTRTLREHPDLDQLKRQAKELLAAFRAGDAGAVAEVNARYREADPAKFALHDAQLVLARSHGFESWPKLKAYVDGVTVKRLVEAVRARDLAQVRAMLEARPELVDMEMAHNDEHLAIHYAVLERAPEMVRLLMEHGANARKGIYPHRDATTALTIATERGYDEIVAIVHAEEQRRREFGSGSLAGVTHAQDELSAAIGRGDDVAAIAMLEVNPGMTDACDRDGWTPLHMASAALDDRLVSWLLEHGADPLRRGKDDRTPLDVAATGTGRQKPNPGEAFATVAARLRAAGAELTARSAAALGEAEWLSARHAQGTLAIPIDWSNGGLLTIAVNHNRPEILELLLDLGFDPDERVRSTESEDVVESQGFPLWQAAAQGNLALATILLDRGANPNVHVYAAGSSVHSAYSHRQWPMVELLRSRGGVLGADTIAVYRETGLARELLANEATGPLAAGMAAPGRTVAEELLDHGASGGDPEIVRMALERIDWPRDDPRWFWILSSPLAFWHHIPWLYAGNRHFDRDTYFLCFRQLLERCDPNMIGRFGRTLLHEVASMREWITAEEQRPFADLLLDAGARLDARDDLLKSTPLGWACRWGRPDLVKLLLERGGDPVEADGEPWATPRAWAEKKGHDDVLAVLRKHEP